MCSKSNLGRLAMVARSGRPAKPDEERHRSAFGAALKERDVRQGVGYVLCGLGGLLLGIVTALLGRSAIAATTYAVERVVLRHLNQQLEYLRTADTAAYLVVASIVADETAHHDRAALAAKRRRFLPAVVGSVIAAATEGVIWIGMHR